MIVRDDGIKFYENGDSCDEIRVLHTFQDNMMIMLDKIEKLEQMTRDRLTQFPTKQYNGGITNNKEA